MRTQCIEAQKPEGEHKDALESKHTKPENGLFDSCRPPRSTGWAAIAA